MTASSSNRKWHHWRTTIICSAVNTGIKYIFLKKMIARTILVSAVSSFCISDVPFRCFNSLVTEGHGLDFKSAMFQSCFRDCYLRIILYQWHLANSKSSLVQMMAFCRDATNHYPCQGSFSSFSANCCNLIADSHFLYKGINKYGIAICQMYTYYLACYTC